MTKLETSKKAKKINVEKCASLLRKQDDILILCHAHPDGDTIGCAYGLCRALLKLGKRARIECGDEIPSKYYYITDEFNLEDFEPKYIVAVDVATENLLGDLEEKYRGKVNLCIDHHPSNTYYAEYLLLNSDAAAACETILKVVKALRVEIDQVIASCLFTGISTDTGCFKYNSTTSNTFRAAAELVDLGADNGFINRLMFETKKKTQAQLEIAVMNAMKFYEDGKICVAIVTQDMYKETGATEVDAEAIPPLTRLIEGTLLGFTIKEKADGTCKVSIRSYDYVDSSIIASSFGGGGHKYAAACRFDCSIEEAEKKLVEKGMEILKK